MSLTKIASLIKSRSSLLLVGLLLLIIVGIMLFLTRSRSENDNQASLLKLPVIDSPQFDGIKLESPGLTQINVKQGDDPKSLKVYSLEGGLREEEGRNIGREFGFLNEPQVFNDKEVGRALFWEKGLEIFGINLDKGTISYEIQITPDSKIAAAKAPSKNLAMESAKDFLSSKSFIKGDLTERGDLTAFYYSNGSILMPVREDQANLVKVYFSESLESLSLESSLGGTMAVTVGPGGEIVGLQYFSLGETEKLNSYPIRDLKQAIEDIKANQGIVVYQEFFGSQEGLQTIRPIRSVNLDSYHFSYYLEGRKQSYLEPVYVFEGTYAGDNGERWKIRICLPAIEEKYLINSSIRGS